MWVASQVYCYFYICVYFFFFFSSRRRHTRYWRDWSSDVCSSDLLDGPRPESEDGLPQIERVGHLTQSAVRPVHRDDRVGRADDDEVPRGAHRRRDGEIDEWVRVRLIPRGQDADRHPTAALRPLRGRLHHAVQAPADEDGIGAGNQESDLLGKGKTLLGGGAAATDNTDCRFPRHGESLATTAPALSLCRNILKGENDGRRAGPRGLRENELGGMAPAARLRGTRAPHGGPRGGRRGSRLGSCRPRGGSAPPGRPLGPRPGGRFGRRVSPRRRRTST